MWFAFCAVSVFFTPVVCSCKNRTLHRCSCDFRNCCRKNKSIVTLFSETNIIDVPFKCFPSCSFVLQKLMHTQALSPCLYTFAFTFVCISFGKFCLKVLTSSLHNFTMFVEVRVAITSNSFKHNGTSIQYYIYYCDVVTLREVRSNKNIFPPYSYFCAICKCAKYQYVSEVRSIIKTFYRHIHILAQYEVINK